MDQQRIHNSLEIITKQANLDAIALGGDLGALDKAIAVTPQPYRLIFTILRETGMRAPRCWGYMSAM